MEKEYAIIDDAHWTAVLALLERDLRLNRQGLVFVAPEYPEAGQEMTVEFDLETEGMNWTGTGVTRTLSRAILADNDPSEPHNIDELQRAVLSLENTAKVIRAAINRCAPA